MELFLWRHADALPGSSDFERALSPLGHRQAHKVAEWFREHAPADLRFLVSPALRTRQTVAHFCEHESDMQLCLPLYENASPNEILSILGWPNLTLPTLIVGHQPELGLLADHLLAGTPHPDHFRKGSLWWLRFEGKQNSAQLVHIMEP
ncbi:MAG: histidine phosphatase family protein [Treponema sp.]|jgi:phosphohistidine phosphatase|nr:histidine phosphatase family protein [Treponema sp.]